ncbi:MAG: cupin domain-containing protein [Chloroflexota bacterium]
MAIDLYKPFTNPITKETFRCISSTPEAYIMEWTVAPGGYVPFEHVHVAQDEIFHVERGEIRARIARKDRYGKAGDTVVAPRGIRHIAYNDKDVPLVCTVEYKPGLDHYTTMQCFAGLTLDGRIDRRGLVHIPRIMYLLKRGNILSLPRPAFAPEFAFRFGMEFFYVVGSILGWEALYKKYTYKS